MTKTNKLNLSLFLLIVLGGIGVVIFSFLSFVWGLGGGHGPYRSVEEWPPALTQLVGANEELRKDVEPYKLEGFMECHSVWRIQAGSPLRDVLFEKNKLLPTDIRHPKATELRRSIPSAWGKYQWERCTWHATPDYGTKHIEGVDLYLIAIDPASGEMIVLHHWIF